MAEVLISGPTPSTFSRRAILTVGSGNWSVPAGVSTVKVMMVGAGGGGGGTGGTTASAAGPGISGAFLSAMYDVTAGATIAYVVGAKGTGGAVGNNSGNTGADTTFGTLTAKGGTGGPGSASGNATGISGANLQALRPVFVPSSSVVVDFTVVNSAVQNAANGVGGTGCATPWGQPGVGATATANGGAATGNGAGGGGGANLTAGATTSGGDGADGLIVVMY